MSQPLKTVVLNGSLQRPSRTRVLLDALHDRLSDELSLDTRFIELPDLVPHIGTALSADELPAFAQSAIDAITGADLLVVGAPVYRGSVPGLFKHLFDLIPLTALTGKPVLLAATGGSARHALVIDHQLRPLFAFFQSLVLPVGVYATSDDIFDGQIRSAELSARIDLAVAQALPVLQHGVPAPAVDFELAEA